MLKLLVVAALQVQPDVKRIKDKLKAEGIAACVRLLLDQLDEWKNIDLNVAVIGNSGAGKSSFINAIRGLSGGQDGSAPVGVVQTTLKPSPYPHPDNTMLKFWDLPGVGTNLLPRKTYLSEINIDRYDFFLLLSANRFTENDVWLSTEIRGRNKKYFFVRTKIGNDLSDIQTAYSRTRPRPNEAYLEQIRQDTKKNLKRIGCQNVPIFLIDNHELHKFDFEKLKQRIIADFPELKRSSLILSLQASSHEIIRLKAKELRHRIWKWALLSALLKIVQIPGITAHDIITREAEFYVKRLGIGRESLTRLYPAGTENYTRIELIVRGALGVENLSSFDMESCLRRVPLEPSPNAASDAFFADVVGKVIVPVASCAGEYAKLKAILGKLENAAMEIANVVVEDIARKGPLPKRLRIS